MRDEMRNAKSDGMKMAGPDMGVKSTHLLVAIIMGTNPSSIVNTYATIPDSTPPEPRHF